MISKYGMNTDPVRFFMEFFFNSKFLNSKNIIKKPIGHVFDNILVTPLKYQKYSRMPGLHHFTETSFYRIVFLPKRYLTELLSCWKKKHHWT